MSDDQTREVQEPITIRRHEEVLEPILQPVDRGVIRVQRRVETVPSEVIADVGHDEVTVERIEIGEPVETAPEPRQEGDTWIIPVIEEQLVLQKRLIVKEEIRLTRRRVTEPVPVSDTIRRHVVDIETESLTGERRPVELRERED
jgi:uncharacterized protein (TIGR02271 family)